ncbi:hypothetical protein RHD99_12190 [Buttiauxella selenatireducens]|uniref:Uncharacterized protein n=1 Tax=Buttiauxella selenatireducens TaxID=3073902 RepID=A0ABY9S428_9ENTR|nr:hypothetical protein [Buttiauxella sp. R73]WMY72258.1 hypothetical protein RHD99_12190 [Buttiauxella sp. R73]
MTQIIAMYSSKILRDSEQKEENQSLMLIHSVAVRVSKSEEDNIYYQLDVELQVSKDDAPLVFNHFDGCSSTKDLMLAMTRFNEYVNIIKANEVYYQERCEPLEKFIMMW